MRRSESAVRFDLNLCRRFRRLIITAVIDMKFLAFGYGIGVCCYSRVWYEKPFPTEIALNFPSNSRSKDEMWRSE